MHAWTSTRVPLFSLPNELFQCHRWGGQQGQFAPGLQCNRPFKQCRTCSNKISLSVTFQSSFFKRLVLLYFRLKSACSLALRFMLLTQVMHNYLMWLLHSLLARARSDWLSSGVGTVAAIAALAATLFNKLAQASLVLSGSEAKVKQPLRYFSHICNISD